MLVLKYLQRLSYEQYGSKKAFAFRHASSEIFLFRFIFSYSEQNPKDFANFMKIRKPCDKT